MKILKMLLLYSIIFSLSNKCFSMRRVSKPPLKKTQTTSWDPFPATQEGNLEELKAIFAANKEKNKINKHNKTLINIAAQNGHLPIVKYLITQNADITTPDKNGNTPLHLAAQNGHLPIVEYLITQVNLLNNANIHNRSINILNNKNSIDGNTPLHLAAQNGHLPIVVYLINNNAHINPINKNKNTPLHLAAQSGHLPIVVYLINNNAHIAAQDANWNTPLHLAAQNGHLSIVEYLITQNAHITAQDANGNTPLHLAAQNGHLSIVEYLININAHTTIKNKNGQIPLDIQDGMGNTLLHNTVTSHNISWVKFLIEHGADTTIKNNNGQAPLDIQDETGNTLLHNAVTSHDIPWVKFLIEHGADTTIKNKNGQMPLDIQDEMGNTLLHNAAQSNNIPLAKFLIEHGADATIKNKNGQMPLDIQDEMGNTLLHNAVASYNIPLTKFLIELKADITIRNNNGQTPLDMQDGMGDTLLHNAVLMEDLNSIKFYSELDTTLVDKPNNFNYTPLQIASIINNKDINDYFKTIRTEALQQQEASYNIKNQVITEEQPEILTEEEQAYSTKEFNDTILSELENVSKSMQEIINDFKNISLFKQNLLDLLSNIASPLPQKKITTLNFLKNTVGYNEIQINTFILGVTFYLKEQFKFSLFPIIIEHKNLTQKALFSCLCQENIENEKIQALLQNLNRLEKEVASITIPLCTSFLSILPPLNDALLKPTISLSYNAQLLTPPATELLLSNTNFKALQNAFNYTHHNILTSTFQRFHDGSRAVDAGGVKRAYNQMVLNLFCSKQKSIFFAVPGHSSTRFDDLIPQGLDLVPAIHYTHENNEFLVQQIAPQTNSIPKLFKYKTFLDRIKFRKRQKKSTQNTANIISQAKQEIITESLLKNYKNDFVQKKYYEAIEFWGLYLFYGMLHGQHPTSHCAKKYYSALECDYNPKNPLIYPKNPRIYFEYIINHDPSILDGILAEPSPINRIHFMKKHLTLNHQALQAFNKGFWAPDSFNNNKNDIISKFNTLVTSIQDLNSEVHQLQKKDYSDQYLSIINNVETMYLALRDMFSILTASDYAYLFQPKIDVDDVINMIEYGPLTHNHSLIEKEFKRALEAYLRKSPENLASFVTFVTGTNIPTNRLRITFLPRGNSFAHTCFNRLDISLEALTHIIVNKVMEVNNIVRTTHNQNPELLSIIENNKAGEIVLTVTIKNHEPIDIPAQQIEDALQEYIAAISTGNQRFTSD